MKMGKYIIGIIVVIVVITLFLMGFRSLENIFNKSGTSINLSRTTVIKELRALNRLETAAFTIEKVIDAGTTGNTFQELLYGDRILLIAHGEVIAGFDLSTLSEKDIVITGQKVTISLPAPQILITTIDNSQTRVYDRKQGLLSKGDKDLETKARLAAQESIADAACKGGILDQASENGRKQLGTLFKTLGFASVTINIPQGSC